MIAVATSDGRLALLRRCGVCGEARWACTHVSSCASLWQLPCRAGRARGLASNNRRAGGQACRWAVDGGQVKTGFW
eukprot:365376-Chlamydomonas_euryale.AAC.12